MNIHGQWQKEMLKARKKGFPEELGARVGEKGRREISNT